MILNKKKKERGDFMSRKLKSFLSFILCISILLSCSAFAFAAKEPDLTPVVIIPGFGQSETIVYDEDGNVMGDTSEFSLESLKTNKLIKNLTDPKKLSALISKTPDLGKYVAEMLGDMLAAFRKNNDGTPVHKTVVRHFDKPYSQYTAEEKAEVDKHISIDGLDAYNSVRYYFTYDTFGSFYESAESLHKFITEVVLPQTGAKKINIVPVSQGGALFAGYLDLYKEDGKYFKKVVSMVPAFDGSIIVGDIFNDRIKIYDADYLDDTALPLLFGDLFGGKAKGYAVSAVLRALLSNEQQTDLIKKALRSVIECLALNNTMMWTLCPTADYEGAKARLLSDDAHASLRSETDRYIEARANLVGNMQELMENGTVVHSICCYGGGCYLPYLFENGHKNADDLLTPASSSLGATSADTGKTLGKDYVSPHTYCSDPTHNHISDDDVIDASTSALPENTWFFSGVSHMGLNNRNDVKDFAAQLIVNDSIVDVYTYPGQSQFVKLPEYTAVKGENGLTYYYAPDGSFVYAMKEKAQENSFDIAAGKLFYSFVKVLSKFIRSVVK